MYFHFLLTFFVYNLVLFISFLLQILLDISHFIQPAYSLKLYQSNVEREVNIEEILENISKNDHNTHLKKNEEKSSCSFEVPINEELPINCIVKTLLSNCRALWRYSEWEEICKDYFVLQ